MVVVAETTGLTQITGTPGTAARTTTPAPYQLPVDQNTLALSSVSALAYRVTDDVAGKGVLYAGTADSVTAADQVDRVLRYDAPGTAGAPAPPIVHASGFSMVGGLGVRPGTDRVMVVDDPALVIEGEPMGLGRMFEIGDPTPGSWTARPTPAPGRARPALHGQPDALLHVRGRHRGRRDGSSARSRAPTSR